MSMKIVREKQQAQALNESNKVLQNNLELFHQQCQEDLDKMAFSKQSYIDQRIKKSYLLQQALNHPLDQSFPAYHREEPISIPPPVSFTEPTKPASYPVDTRQDVEKSVWNESERNLAAALELQLGSYISRLHQVCFYLANLIHYTF